VRIFALEDFIALKVIPVIPRLYIYVCDMWPENNVMLHSLEWWSYVKMRFIHQDLNLCVLFLNNLMELSESVNRWDDQDFIHLLRFSKVHYRVNESSTRDPTLIQSNPEYNLLPYFLNIRMNFFADLSGRAI
jgi:hypothetical protein